MARRLPLTQQSPFERRGPLGGHSRPNWAVRVMSGLPPLATVERTSLEVRFVPEAEVLSFAIRLATASAWTVSL